MTLLARSATSGANPVTGARTSYQKLATELFEFGFMNAKSKPYKQDFIYWLLKMGRLASTYVSTADPPPIIQISQS